MQKILFYYLKNFKIPKVPSSGLNRGQPNSGTYVVHPFDEPVNLGIRGDVTDEENVAALGHRLALEHGG